MVAAVALFAVGAVVGAAKPNMLSSIMSDGFAMGDQMKITNSMMVGLGNAAWGGASVVNDEVAVLGTQPPVELQSWDPAHIGTLRFNPCKTDIAEYEASEWSTANVKPWCKVDAAQCAFCAWVLQFDSEYRVNDIVTCLGPTYKIAAEAVVHDPKFKGTILERMLNAKGKHPNGSINFYADHFQEAKDNFQWMINAIWSEQCDVPDHSTLIVHIRAGDNLNDDFKNIPHIGEAIQQMKDYVANRPYITRIELSSVLHFGVPAPDAAFKYNDGVGDAYMMSDEALRKNGLILGHIYEAAKSTGRDVWFSSTNDPDKDICRYAKACHFLTASLSKEEMVNEGPMEQRLSFSELVRDLHMHLSTCDAHDTAEWGVDYSAGASAGSTATAEIGEAEEPEYMREPKHHVASANSILSALVGHNAQVQWRS